MVDLKKKTPLSDLIWRGMKVNLWSLAWPLNSWPKKIALLAQKLVRLTCGKSNNMVKNPNW